MLKARLSVEQLEDRCTPVDIGPPNGIATGLYVPPPMYTGPLNLPPPPITIVFWGTPITLVTLQLAPPPIVTNP